jgi:hypothetical protein
MTISSFFLGPTQCSNRTRVRIRAIRKSIWRRRERSPISRDRATAFQKSDENAHVAKNWPSVEGFWRRRENELICSFSLGKVVEAAGVETKGSEFSNLLMARDF